MTFRVGRHKCLLWVRGRLQDIVQPVLYQSGLPITAQDTSAGAPPVSVQQMGETGTLSCSGSPPVLQYKDMHCVLPRLRELPVPGPL